MAKQLQDALYKPELPEGEVNPDPQKYKPITCLPTVYKIFTTILARSITQHIKQNNLLAYEQNGCKKNARGCKELLAIDVITGEQARRKKRNISIAWIDYKKAFDSVPHSWLLRVLDIYKINQAVKMCLHQLMYH